MYQNEEFLKKIAVYGVIFNEKNELLVIKRAAHDSHPGMWEIPGGALDHKEDPARGTQREVYEETGLSVSVLFPFATLSGTSTKGYHVIRIAYLCKLSHGNQMINLSNDHADYQWINPSHTSSLNRSEFLDHVLTVLKTFPHLLKV